MRHFVCVVTEEKLSELSSSTKFFKNGYFVDDYSAHALTEINER